jgi:hypothetical protein
MKSSSGTLGHDVFYRGRLVVIESSEFREFENSRVEAVSNTSTVALRVVGGDEKGSLKSETVKYGHESNETRTREYTALARISSNCKRQTRPLVRESAPHQQTSNCLTVIKIWS